LRNYMRTNDMMEDPFLKQLCDDIHITYITRGTRHADMYSTSRQTSQGLQRSYTTPRAPTHTPESGVFRLVRQNAMERSNAIPRSNAMDEFDDFQTPSPDAEHTIGNIDDLASGEDDEIDNYVSVDTNVSCYTTPSALNTMRSVSCGVTQPDYGDAYYTPSLM